MAIINKIEVNNNIATPPQSEEALYDGSETTTPLIPNLLFGAVLESVLALSNNPETIGDIGNNLSDDPETVEDTDNNQPDDPETVEDTDNNQSDDPKTLKDIDNNQPDKNKVLDWLGEAAINGYKSRIEQLGISTGNLPDPKDLGKRIYDTAKSSLKLRQLRAEIKIQADTIDSLIKENKYVPESKIQAYKTDLDEIARQEEQVLENVQVLKELTNYSRVIFLNSNNRPVDTLAVMQPNPNSGTPPTEADIGASKSRARNNPPLENSSGSVATQVFLTGTVIASQITGANPLDIIKAILEGQPAQVGEEQSNIQQPNTGAIDPELTQLTPEQERVTKKWLNFIRLVSVLGDKQQETYNNGSPWDGVPTKTGKVQVFKFKLDPGALNAAVVEDLNRDGEMTAEDLQKAVERVTEYETNYVPLERYRGRGIGGTDVETYKAGVIGIIKLYGRLYAVVGIDLDLENFDNVDITKVIQLVPVEELDTSGIPTLEKLIKDTKENPVIKGLSEVINTIRIGKRTYLRSSNRCIIIEDFDPKSISMMDPTKMEFPFPPYGAWRYTEIRMDRVTDNVNNNGKLPHFHIFRTVTISPDVFQWNPETGAYELTGEDASVIVNGSKSDLPTIQSVVDKYKQYK